MGKKKFVVDAKKGIAAIYDSSRPQAEDSPESNLPYLYFHSKLKYMAMRKKIIKTINFPSKTVNSSYSIFGGGKPPPFGESEYSLGTNSFGSDVFFLPVVGGIAISGGYPLYANSQSMRAISVVLDGSTLKCMEKWRAYGTVSIPAQSVTIKTYIFSSIEFPYSNTKGLLIDENGISIGNGKIDTRHGHLRKGAGFLLPTSRTMKVSNGGYSALSTSGVSKKYWGSTAVVSAIGNQVKI